jgi:hypothetical protein
MVYSNVDKLEKPKQRTSFGAEKIMAANTFLFSYLPLTPDRGYMVAGMTINLQFLEPCPSARRTTAANLVCNDTDIFIKQMIIMEHI